MWTHFQNAFTRWFEKNSLCIHHNDFHLTCSVFLHYLVKVTIQKCYQIFMTLKTNVIVYSKSVSIDNFRGISISSVVSKLFEHCILDWYGGFLLSSDNQFGLKKKSSCMHAIYTLRSVDYYVSNGSVVNICALDISKAFDKVTFHGLFLKLMQNQILLKLLCILENWFKLCSTCIKWGSVVSRVLVLTVV